MNNTQPTYERDDSPTPNGGSYSIAYFLDANGNPAPKDRAVKGEVLEFDDQDIQINSTMFTMS